MEILSVVVFVPELAKIVGIVIPVILHIIDVMLVIIDLDGDGVKIKNFSKRFKKLI